MNRSQTSGRVGSAVFLLLFFLFLLPFLHVLRGGGHLALLVESGGDDSEHRQTQGRLGGSKDSCSKAGIIVGVVVAAVGTHVHGDGGGGGGVHGGVHIDKHQPVLHRTN